MIFGLLAGGLLRGQRSVRDKTLILLAAGVSGLAAGMLIEWLGLCPIVKRIWTPSWALYSSGWATIALACFYFVIDGCGLRRWAFPLVVVGMNSITMYVLVHLSFGFVSESLKTHLGQAAFTVCGEAYEPIVLGGAVLAIFWLICWWMYRRGIFLRL
jgi:predicted acyltransferase